jgi:hypothetical protein
MLAFLPYRIRLTRRHQQLPRPALGLRTHRLRRPALLATMTAVGMSGFFALPAAAASGSVATTVNIAMVSLTVSPGAVTLAQCSGGNSTPTRLGFPNATCTGGTVTVTNSGAGSHISMQGGNAIPSDNGTPWSLICPASTPQCATWSTPGADQFGLELIFPIGGGEFVLPTPQPDVMFGTGGAATSGQSVPEPVDLWGPASSTDPSPSFTTTITWTAF